MSKMTLRFDPDDPRHRRAARALLDALEGVTAGAPSARSSAPKTPRARRVRAPTKEQLERAGVTDTHVAEAKRDLVRSGS